MFKLLSDSEEVVGFCRAAADTGGVTPGEDARPCNFLLGSFVPIWAGVELIGRRLHSWHLVEMAGRIQPIVCLFVCLRFAYFYFMHVGIYLHVCAPHAVAEETRRGH